ncbi:MAG: nitrate reductase molybdenum cofactor assembly chaperone [Chloroflexi bacterium]|nr:nitrate reductase molybdenum cofactor assembly chaperone [Chloroflexota bacterium]
MLTNESKQLCHLFANLLNYPNPDMAGVAEDCAREVEQSFPNLAGTMRTFANFVKGQSLEALEEFYTQTFDVTPASTLYVGYHLFGETPKRSAFLVKLEESYKACSFSGGTELADHLGVVLRFLSDAQEPEFVLPLLEECLLPVLTKMGKELTKNDNQYALVTGPLRVFLQHVSQQLVKTGGVPNA